MEVNALAIKELRNKRAYTQQHLADACGVSLRTIQRVERYGTTSMETLMSLSAVFEVDKQNLLNVQQDEQPDNDSSDSSYLLILWLAIAVTSGAALGALATYLLLG